MDYKGQLLRSLVKKNRLTETRVFKGAPDFLARTLFFGAPPSVLQDTKASSIPTRETELAFGRQV